MSVAWSRIGHQVRTVRHQARWLFALPCRRLITVVTALGVAVVLDGFGAAAGTWTASRTAAGLPHDAALADLSQQASGGSPSLRSDGRLHPGPSREST